MVKISVIVPVFNGERTIKKCLESILRSEFQGFSENSGGLVKIELEVVVVNNGSTDSTLEIVDSIASKDSRLFVYTQENKGPAGSRQTGLEKSTGDLICWVDSDDWVEPRWLESMYAAMVNNDADIIVTQCTIERDFNSEKTFNPENERIKEVWDRDGAINAFLDHKKLNGTLWTKMIKRELFEGVSFNLDQWYWEDQTVVWKVLLKCKKVVKLSSAYYHWWLHEDSMCAKPLSEGRIRDSIYIADMLYEDCREDVLKKHYKMAEEKRLQSYYGIIKSIIAANKSYPVYEKIIISTLRHNFMVAYHSLSSVKDTIMLCMIVLSPSLTKWAVYGLKKMLR